MESFVIIIITLVVSLFIADMFHFFKSSRLIGLMVTGIIFSFPVFDIYFSKDVTKLIELLSKFGILFLLFITGLEINSRLLKKCGADEVRISIFSAGIPLLLGYVFGILIGLNHISSFILGAALSISSEGASAMLLIEMGKLKSKVGTIILGAGIIDDVLEIIFLTIVVFLVQDNVVNVYSFIIKVAFFVLFITLIFKILSKRLISHLLNASSMKKDSGAVLSIIIIIVFFISSLSIFMGLGEVIGAFIAGLILQKIIKDEKEKELIVKEISDFSFAVIIPFFFIFIGLNFDYVSIIDNPYIFIGLLAVAIVGKILGSIVTKPFSKLKFKQLMLVGWGMNSRGAMELVIAEIARSAGLINQTIYSNLVLIAIVTTFIFPFAIKHYLKRWPDVMD